MPPKVQLDKAAWGWLDYVEPSQISDEHIKAAYRIHFTRCQFGYCRRNCRGNPYCLSGLGKSKWLGEVREDDDDDDVDLEIRKPNTFVGLRNLGATCYVNSLLQLWFHNLSFRRAIFSWKGDEDPVERDLLDSNGDGPPRTAVAHLQMLFALMQFGKRRFEDPSDFIKSLNLDITLQQDAQEFSKLFISLLDESLSQQSNLSVRNMINNNFKGEYSYVTRCSHCFNESDYPSMFYELELNVKGHKTLEESISEFLKEERLEGADMYFCGVCQQKREATRHIKLRSLPPVLNLQLMRFIFDRQKGHKKKLNTSIQFPDTLDMSKYLNVNSEEPKEPNVYKLTAVLIHEGPSAYSGHYIAHICDQTTGNWYKFNDENVEKLEGKKLKLTCEDDAEFKGPKSSKSDDGEEGAPKKTKAPRLGKGFLASSDAYMLVYTSIQVDEAAQPITEETLDSKPLKVVQRTNDEFNALLEAARLQKRHTKAEDKVRRDEIVDLFSNLPIRSDDSSMDVISTQWLINWLNSSQPNVEPVNNALLLCPHGGLDPNKLNEAKYVNSIAAEQIYQKYNGGPRILLHTMFCKDCVVLKCKSIRIQHQISEDFKEISNLLKVKVLSESSCYWVGKRSLKEWRRKALTHRLGELYPSGRSTEDEPSQTIKRDPSPMSSHSGLSCSEPEGAQQNPPRMEMDEDPYSSPSAYQVGRKEWRVVLPRQVTVSQVNEAFTNIVDKVSSEWQTIGRKNEATGVLSLESIGEVRGVVAKLRSLSSMLQELCDQSQALIQGGSRTPSLNGDESGRHRKRRKLDLGGGEGASESMESGCDDETEPRINGRTSRSEEDVDDHEEDFNEDILCVHGNLTIEEPLRRLVSEQVWKILHQYFPKAREFPGDTKPCYDCLCLASEGEVAKDMSRNLAIQQKDLLYHLFSNRNRPKLRNFPYKYPVVSAPDFLEPWRRFIREAGKVDPLFCLRNSTLICEHERLLYNPDLKEDMNRFALLTHEEYEKLIQCYRVDKHIYLSWDPETCEVTTDPPVCEQCLPERLKNEQQALLNYAKAKIYIRQVSKPTAVDDLDTSNETWKPSSHKKQVVVANNGGVTASAADNKLPGTNGTVKTNGDSNGSLGPVGGWEVVRRSTRHRKVKGEKELFVSSEQTLMELKLQVLNTFMVAPFDQHLMTEDGRELTDLTATLSSLNIYPNSVILLKVDEPPEDDFNTPVEDYIRKSEPESGFKGTGLLKRS